MADRIGMAIVAAALGIFFFLCAFDFFSWSSIANSIWAGVGGIICFYVGIRAAMGKGEMKPLPKNAVIYKGEPYVDLSKRIRQAFPSLYFKKNDGQTQYYEKVRGGVFHLLGVIPST